ncbi:MAG: DNA primase [Jiangellales bacterium]
MPGRIRDADIAEIRERATIDSVVGEYVSLRNAGGGSMKGLCPFHDERSPSFHVTPARGLWYCFGCGEGGDVISFLERIEHVSFAEAIERLADRAGVQLVYEESAGGRSARGPQREQRTRMVEAHKAAAEYFADQLATPEAVAARQFLDERGFDRAAAEHFGVGFSPRTGEALRQHLLKRGFSDDDMVAGGLVVAGQRSPYDRFRGRLMWPIRDLMGAVVGFGARRLFDDDRIDAKYLNTPETPLYRKSTVLYGVDLAKKEIARQSRAVVVEGYTDVMACHLAGVTTAVATCGTSFGEDHAKVLRRLLMDQDEFRGEVVFTFDGDEAGKKAALRAFSGDQRFVAQTYVAIEPDGRDPCDLRIDDGDAAVRELVARRRPLFEFAITSSVAGYDLDVPEGRTQALDHAIPLVARIKDHALRDEYARRLAGWVGAPDELAVVHRVRGASGARARRPAAAPAQGQQSLVADHGNVDPQVLAAEREALKVALQRPALAGPFFDDLDPAAFASPAHRAIAEAIASSGGVATQSGGPGWVQTVLGSVPTEATAGVVRELAVAPIAADDESLPRYVVSSLARLHGIWVSRRLVTVKATLQRTDPESDAAAYNKLFGELMSLESMRRDLRERAISGL